MSKEIALTRIKNVYNYTLQLDLSNLNLTDLPLELLELTQLIELDLSHNELTQIKDLEKLTNLNVLLLADNKLSQIEGLENLANLSILDLSMNSINTTEYIDKIIQKNILVWLDISNNLLHSISETIYKFYFNILTNPKSILIIKNKAVKIQKYEWAGYTRDHERVLLGLADEFDLDKRYSIQDRAFRHLIYYIYDRKTIKNPPTEIIDQGYRETLEYFDQKKKSGEELLNEAKLILLGDGRSGKTSFARRLLKRELPKEIDRTQGVDISIGEYSFPLENGKIFKINIWDFAGQDKYKTLHQLFYTESSLYVMVAESGNMTTDFDDWLQTAALFGEGSPLILVLNEFKPGIGMSSFDSNYWKKQFPNLLKEVFTVNLGTTENFTSVEKYVRLLVQSLPHTKYVFPSNWAAIRRILNERRNEQFITLKEYLKICNENGLPERESALVLSAVLHQVGDCLHYQKNELLKQFIILKNEWATEAVYKILDDKKVAEEKYGFFDLSDLERIWNNSEYEDMRPQLLELMKQFKMAYQLPNKEEFVTPPLLPPASPKGYSWPDIESLELFIEYEFLPKALLTQFIVTRHADIAEGRTLVWRHGVVLKWNNETLAEVSKTKLFGRDAFHIRSQGISRKEIMTVILKTFRELHLEYRGIKYIEKVQCPCEGCKKGSNSQYYFDFNNLQLRIERGRYDAECNNSLMTVNVIKLLENSFIFEKFQEGVSLQLKEKVVSNDSKIRLINLFLASSNELILEREKIEQSLGRKNKSLLKQGYFIELLIWEDGKYIGNSTRSQDNYNLEIEQCDLFVMMFYSKVGKYTLEEFVLANSLFENKKAPRICVFQKDIDLPKNQGKADADSRFEFLNKLRDMEYFPVLFNNTDKMANELELIIDKLLQDKLFIERLSS